MPITPQDIQLLESERMRDTPDGGGRQTGNVIVSGQMGNVFPKVSRTDAVYGRVNLRKIYAAVRTATTEMYAGAHAAVIAPPENDRINIALFSTRSAFDDRTAARNRIESYVVKGPLSRMRLYGDQYEGQMAVATYQRTDEPLPDIGEVFVLSIEGGGLTPDEQYVRITDVEHEVRTFTDAGGEFQRRVLTLKIGSRLRRTFPGAEISRFSTDSSPTKVRVSQVADASTYYGIRPIVEAANINDVGLQLDTVFSALVPSTQREVPIANAQIVDAFMYEPSASVNNSLNTGSWVVGTKYHMRRTFRPGSLTYYLQWTVPFIGGYNETGFDDGDGILRSSASGTPERGTIDYETGVITATTSPMQSNATNRSAIFTYLPAASVSNPAHTRQIPITLATRGTVYVETLLPVPAPGTVIIDYRALGKWYRLRDDGQGQITGTDPSVGVGSIDYVTGSCVLTLGALPDIESAILFSWGSPVHYAIRAGASSVADDRLVFTGTLQHRPMLAGSLSLSWVTGSTTRTATADNNGVISGNATGSIDRITGDYVIRFTTPPNRGSLLTLEYDWLKPTDPGEASAVQILSLPRGSTYELLPGIDPATIRCDLVVEPPFLSRFFLTATGQSDGTLVVKAGQVRGPAQTVADTVVAVYDSITGVVTLTGQNPSVQFPRWEGGNTWTTQTSNAGISTSGGENVFVFGFGDTTPESETITAPVEAVTLDLTATITDAIVPGSVLFRMGGKTYADRNGSLVADVSPTTGSGTPAGTINYATGDVTITFWADNEAIALTVDALLTKFGDWTAVEAFFRTAGSPIRPASLFVQATAEDGTLLTATANQNGVISGAKVRGNVQQDMGVVAVEFGEEVLGEWEPLEVMPGTLRYNAVLQTNLPLDAAILGLDPVRLPADGRVPIYRPADIVLVHHTDETELDNPVVADETYDLGRTDLAVVTLHDANGAAIPEGRYSVDLEAGELTIAADWTGLDGEGDPVPQPLVARHRIEDMGLVSDVAITGRIEISTPLTHNYPAGAYVSGCLLYGDLFAHVTNVFDQQTWSGVWSDALIGSQATAQYDDINYPIEVLNESAVTDRWRINFTSTTAFQVISENVGVVGTGTTSTDTAPVNPVTGEAYFVIRADGWGAGWASGNQLRFNVVGASGPTWIARTILAGASLAGDEFKLEARGDVD